MKSQLTTPQAIAEYMTAYFTYDPNHYGMTPYNPSDFNARRSGDCKDYSTFFSDILASHGYTAHQYVFRYDASNNYGHVVSIFTDTNGNNYVATNKGGAEMIYGPISSVDDAGTLCVANGVLPSGSIHDNWMRYPAGFTGYLVHSHGIAYNSDYAQAISQLSYFFHPTIYMHVSFTVGPHPGPQAYGPQALNAGKVGDAKDFAVFDVVRSGGVVYSFRYNQATGASHVISVIKAGDDYYFHSNRYLFGPLETLDYDAIVALLKANGHIPANSQADDWRSYPPGYTGPFPVATPSAISAVQLLLQ